jgi:transcriptional regulator of acetoin/glycerol metabolism
MVMDCGNPSHARALQARHRLPPEGLPGPAVLDSWVRCLDAGLDAHAELAVPVVEEADLRQRRERADVLRRLAQVELETLSRQIAGSNFLLAFADADGVILDLYADNRFSMSGRGAGIVAGSCWAEATSGTNGLGTALAIGAPVAVTGLEHYFLSLGDVSCTAAPVRDARGDIVGVLDASSYFQSRQQHTQALVQMAATHIENGLLLQQMSQHWVLALHPRAEFLGTLSAGLLAFDVQGRLLAANARASQLLQGLDASPGAVFESLFGEPFERVVARLQRQGQLRLRDSFGCALVVQCVGRPVIRALATSAQSPSSGSSPALSSGFAAGTALAAAPAPDDGAVMADPAVAQAYELATAAVRRQVPLLLYGETGTGKELLARHAHRASRRSGPFVAVNCGALPAELIEAELFGYTGGAFSGSRREGSIGLIASADGGSLLLDEVGELPLGLQASLLRFLDDREVRPVGSTTPRKVDVQLLAATHADLEAEVAARRFRADLLYRLNTVCLRLPPLRKRQDFAQVVQALLVQMEPGASVTDEALALLASHDWPGNVRELRSVLTRALLQGSLRIQADKLVGCLPSAASVRTQVTVSSLQQGAAYLVRTEFARLGNVSATARTLGISRTTVYRHLRGSA